MTSPLSAVPTASSSRVTVLLVFSALSALSLLAGFVWSLGEQLPWLIAAAFGLTALIGLAFVSVFDHAITDSELDSGSSTGSDDPDSDPNSAVVEQPVQAEWRTQAVFLFIFVVAIGCVGSSVWGPLPDEFGFAALCASVYTSVRLVDRWRRCAGTTVRVRITWASLVLGLGAFSVSQYATSRTSLDVGTGNAGKWATVLWVLLAVVAVVAALLGAVAVEFWSTAFPERLTNGRIWWFGIGLAVVVASCWAIRYLAATDWPVAMWLTVILGVIAALLITSNDSIILFGVLLLVAFWATVPRSTSMPPGQAADPVSVSDDDSGMLTSPRWFAVLGDSYISGEGAEVYFDGTNIATPTFDGYDHQCRRAPTAWPMLLNPIQTFDQGDIENVPQRVLFAACSGAVTADLRANECGTLGEFQVRSATPCTHQQRQDLNDVAAAVPGSDVDKQIKPDQVAVLASAIRDRGDPAFVFVSIGGNDVQFSDVGKVCIAPHDCNDYVDAVMAAQLDEIGPNLERTYGEIRKTVGPTVPVIAVPYPKPVAETEDCRGVILAPGDRDDINRFATALNAEIRVAADAAGVWYLDAMETSLADSARQLCSPNGQTGLNFLNVNPKAGSLWASLWPLNWTHNFIHPNERGHEAMAGAAMRWLTTETDEPGMDPTCILADTCASREISADLTKLSTEPSTWPSDESTIAPLAHSLGRAGPNAWLIGGITVAGWWLALTAFTRRVAESGPRKPSLLERPVLWWLQSTNTPDDPE